MSGWIKLHRRLLNSLVFDNPDLLKVWVWCLLKATHTEREQIVGMQIVKLNKGEFIFGRSKAAKELSMSESKVYRTMETLKNRHQITIKANNKYSLISIVNWELYQEDDMQLEQQMNSKRTTDEQQMNTNKNVKNIYSSSSSSKEKNGNSEISEVFQFYQNNIGFISPFQVEVLNSYMDDGIEADVVVEAMKDSLGADNKWKYLMSILNRCMERNVHTATEYNANKLERENKKVEKALVQEGTSIRQFKQFKTKVELEEEAFELNKKLALEALDKEGGV